MHKIGKIIKDAMTKMGWSNYRLSKVTGILENNLTIILGEKGNPQWSTIQKILDAIDCEVVIKKKSRRKRKKKGGKE